MISTNTGEPQVLQRVVKKRTEPFFDARTAYLTFLIICSALASAWLGGWIPFGGPASNRPHRSFPGSTPATASLTDSGSEAAAWKIAAGNDLFEKGLYQEAAELMEGAIQSPDFPLPMVPGASYRLGLIYADSLNQPRKAAKWFAAARKLASKQPGKLENDASRRLVECLERSGQPREAKKVLAESADLVPSRDASQPSGDTVLASIDGRNVTLMALESWVPSHLRSRLDTTSGRTELLKQFLARELLVNSAARAGIDREPDVAVRIDETRKDILADAAMRAEFSKIAEPDEGTLELFIKADPKRWSSPWEAALSVMTLTSEASASAVMKRIEAGEDFRAAGESSGGRVTTGAFTARNPVFEGLGRLPAEIVDKLGSLGEGGLLGPVTISGAIRVIRASEVRQPKPLTLAEAGNRVREAWRHEAEARSSREYIERLLGSGEVKIFDDALKGGTTDGDGNLSSKGAGGDGAPDSPAGRGK